MIALIEGRVISRSNHTMILLAGGIGYAVQTTYAALALGGEVVRLYTRMIVREDGIELFGFPTQDEVAMFDRLTSVSGVGPRMALSVLSALSTNDLVLAVASGDEKAFTRISGIGKKTAQRLLLELKDLAGDALTAGGTSGGGAPIEGDSPEREALEALMALGFTASEAGAALIRARGQAESAADFIRLALKALNKS